MSGIQNSDFEFKGFIEGNELMNGNVNVIVSDGFTGNVAKKPLREHKLYYKRIKKCF